MIMGKKMWDNLDPKKRKHYRKLITNFASLTEAFSQKSDDNIVPILNSKYQEKVFQTVFDAKAEDIANTSYDASVITSDGSKYLVGIKSFRFSAANQKVAQFKAQRNNVEWNKILDEIYNNARKVGKKSDLNRMNSDLYISLAKKISEIRNARIRSSREQIRGFDITDKDDVKSIYHVLMPSGKNSEGKPCIYVGETDYSEIDIKNINNVECNKIKTPGNFTFSDGRHKYSYSSADCQLMMNFDNKNIIVEEWPVNYVDNAISIFENLKSNVEKRTVESYSWKINVEKYSGYNSFYGVGSKQSRNMREKRIERLISKYSKNASVKFINKLNLINVELRRFLLEEKESSTKEKIRKNLLSLFDDAIMQEELELKKEIIKLVYRPTSEMYIPIPNAKKFHEQHPNFFCKKPIFCEKKGKLVSKEDRKFTLRFMPSQKKIEAYICQDNGKAIQSTERQDILGEWILRKVFQLAPYEPLTKEVLETIGINGIRLSKYDNTSIIELNFIWIDEDDLPVDFWQ